VLAWAQVAAQNVAELGYQFTAQAPQALALFGRSGTEKWLLNALDAYDKQGLYPACAALKDLAGFKRASDAAGAGVALSEVVRVLELFLRGLAGRGLQLEAAGDTWTDTETIFLPSASRGTVCASRTSACTRRSPCTTGRRRATAASA